MTLKNVKIDETLYKELLERKKEDETISDVIGRMLHSKRKPHNIKKVVGLWKDIPKDYLEIMEADRKELREKINRRFS